MPLQFEKIAVASVVLDLLNVAIFELVFICAVLAHGAGRVPEGVVDKVDARLAQNHELLVVVMRHHRHEVRSLPNQLL